ncbi:hypothetical protein IQ07DRAFT_603805 [Pyrenochaeta sp. DS3sAY3a]|nr:hypothetical protein IQ07DRAFT_603805 [Pyrenochaeta sp. DS3sAY3a]
MASRRSQALPFIFLLSSIVGFVTALPSNPSSHYPKLSARLEPQRLETTNAANLQKHIEVYGIPYGVLGVVSHGLTFYVIICHFFGRRPLFPWRFLEKEKWNLAAVTVSSLISIILSSVTLARTRGSRPLMILAGMQIVLGAIIDFIHIHRVALKAEGWSKSLSLWAIPLVIVSVFSIYAFYQFPFTEKDGRIGNIYKSIGFILLLAFIGLSGLATLFCFLGSVCTMFKESTWFAVSAVSLSCALFWLGDFGIAVVSKNSIGTPGTHIQALYYTYWVVERIPLLTF